jgi:hypothetical protein
MAERHKVVTDPFTRTLIKIKAAQLCRRSDFSRSDYDDLRQGMLLYLLEKEHLFDPQRGTLEAFVTNAINTWVGLELRFRGRDKRRGNIEAISLEGTAIEFNGETDTLDALVGDADLQRRTHAHSRSPIDLLEIAEAVRHAFGNLTSAEQILLVHVAEHGVASTAREWTRRTRRKVSRRQVENAIARMRQRFEDSGLGAG